MSTLESMPPTISAEENSTQAASSVSVSEPTTRLKTKWLIMLGVGALCVGILYSIISIQNSRKAENVIIHTITPTGISAKLITTPTPVFSHSTLAFTQNTLVATSSSTAIGIVIDTQSDFVSAVQLELAYDPSVITNVTIKPGPFFQNPVILPISFTNSYTGRVRYALSLSANSSGQNGKGVIAVISFQQNLKNGAKTQIAFLPSPITIPGKPRSYPVTSSNLMITK